jgi:hypothetical protein
MSLGLGSSETFGTTFKKELSLEAIHIAIGIALLDFHA